MIDVGSLRNFYEGKKVLITGHTGFKGSYLSLILSFLGARVFGVALKPSADPPLFDIMYGQGAGAKHETDLYLHTGDPGIKYGIEESLIADIRDYETLSDYMERVAPDIVMHLAAQPIVKEGYRIPRETYEINVLGTVNVLECIRNSKSVKAFINVTTDKVYLNEERPDYSYREDDKLDGFDPYANSKSCSELVTHSYFKSFLRERGVAVSTMRAGNVIGGGDFSPYRIIPDAMRSVLNNEKLVIRNPLSVRPYEHVYEPLMVYILMALREYEDINLSSAYNVCPNKEDEISTGELAKLFASSYGEGMDLEIKEETNAPHEAGLLRLDNTKIKETLNWEPVWHIEKAVKCTVEWLKAYREGNETSNRQILDSLREYLGECNS